MLCSLLFESWIYKWLLSYSIVYNFCNTKLYAYLYTSHTSISYSQTQIHNSLTYTQHTTTTTTFHLLYERTNITQGPFPAWPRSSWSNSEEWCRPRSLRLRCSPVELDRIKDWEFPGFVVVRTGGTVVVGILIWIGWRERWGRRGRLIGRALRVLIIGNGVAISK